ncbi:N-acetylmuramate alpha-1-phosphate uridylyltransferase [soil metagenome]
MHALILAAGRGARMRPLTDHTPKPLLAVGGKPLVVRQIEALRRAGIVDIAINVGWLGHCFEPVLGDGSAFGVRLAYSVEPSTAWETGGGIATALELLGDGPFVVASGDIETDFDYSALLAPAAAIAADPDHTAAHFVLVDNPPFHPLGDMALDGSGRVQRSGTLLNYGNIGVFHPQLFAHEAKRAQWKLFPWAYRFVDQQRVSGQHHRGRWNNVGTPEQLDRLDRLLT